MTTEPSAAGDGPGDRAPSRAPGRSFEPRHLESPSTGPALVDIADLTVTLTTRRGPVTAVNGVTFTLRTGETLGVVGESGSGKSMLIRSILSLVPPNATIGGEITLGAR
ncbi:MAG: oppD, partial [Acidimicrobiaceae bacterium]|nr:oppD [Acidimicrobiaceae bacterium]